MLFTDRAGNNFGPPVKSYRRQGKLLSQRELEVLELKAEGLTNDAVADVLSINIETVKTHIVHINQKLRAKNTNNAIWLAVKTGQLEP